jgi:hypothetical protein
MNEVTTADIKRANRLKAGAIAAPIVLTVIPAVITIVLTLLAAGGPPAAVLMLFGGIVATVIGLITGVVTSAILVQKRSALVKQLKDRMAARGIRAEEIDWFRSELKGEERRALKSLEQSDLLLADAYRETLASRLTASRMIKESRRELMLSKRRSNSLKQLKTQRADDFQSVIAGDIRKLETIGDEARVILAEADARLRMIEAAGTRGGSIADSELALKKLSARTSELPLALESAKMADEIRLELAKEGIDYADDELNDRR